MSIDCLIANVIEKQGLATIRYISVFCSLFVDYTQMQSHDSIIKNKKVSALLFLIHKH